MHPPVALSFCSVLSCPVLSSCVLFCSMLFCPVLSCPILVLCCPVLSCAVLFCSGSVLFCHGSVLVLSCFCPVLSFCFCPGLFCPVLFCSDSQDAWKVSGRFRSCLSQTGAKPTRDCEWARHPPEQRLVPKGLPQFLVFVFHKLPFMIKYFDAYHVKKL